MKVRDLFFTILISMSIFYMISTDFSISFSHFLTGLFFAIILWYLDEGKKNI